MPIPIRNRNGIANESSRSIIAASAITTATATYFASSLSHRFLRSSTSELIPEI